MKRLLVSLALALGSIAAAPVVMPEAAPKAAANLYFYRYYSNGLIYTYMWEWPGVWILINVEPAGY